MSTRRVVPRSWRNSLAVAGPRSRSACAMRDFICAKGFGGEDHFVAEDNDLAVFARKRSACWSFASVTSSLREVDRKVAPPAPRESSRLLPPEPGGSEGR